MKEGLGGLGGAAVAAEKGKARGSWGKLRVFSRMVGSYI
jgi:hypothetical protein